MGVKIRQRKWGEGKLRLSLDIYDKGIRKTISLNMYIFEKPKTVTEKQHNKEIKRVSEQIRAEKELELLSGEIRYASDIKFSDLFDKYLGTLESENSKRTYLSVNKHLFEFADKELKLPQINKAWSQRFLEYLYTKLSINSANGYFAKFNVILNYAVKHDLLSKNPAATITKKKNEETVKEFLEENELKLLFDDYEKNDHWRDTKKTFLFSCLTGFRYSDIQELTWKDIKESKIVYKQIKTKKPEWIPLSEKVKTLIGERGGDNEKVFKTEHKTWLNLKLKDWVQSLGINKNITIHCGRHTFATYMLTKGVDLYTVSKLLGHSDIRTTQIYAKLVDSKKSKAINVFDDI